jgi:acetate kinase
MARILVVNAGSSTLKLSLIEDERRTLWSRELEAPRAPATRAELDAPQAPATQAQLDAHQPRVNQAELDAAVHEVRGRVDAVGHRIVHGGERFRNAVHVDSEVEGELRRLTALAPLHQPKSLAALDAVSAALPGVPAFACFDTGFHADLPDESRTYALPAAWRTRWPVRRYGFHGLSHSWVARRAPELVDASKSGLRIVSCHLGAGASLCAIAEGRSRATTMGFTPLEGLVMATRSGDVDPGLVLWLLEEGGMSTEEVGHALEHGAGLLGLAGSADMRTVLARAAEGDAEANLALGVYVHRLCGGIAAMAAAIRGLDTLVFTGGVGERSARIRAVAAERLAFLGVAVDSAANAGSGDREISPPGAAVRTLVIEAREDLEIARQVSLARG